MSSRQRETGLSWKSLFSRNAGRNQSKQPTINEESENPWFALQRPSQHEEAEGGFVRDSAQTGSRSTARWLSDSSPYGFSDEDGTLKQVDSPNWRKAFGDSNRQRFVPNSGSARWQGLGQKPQRRKPSTGSTWLLQTVAAVALVLGGLYVSHAPGQLAQRVDSVYKSAFAKDYSAGAIPAVETFLQDHHVNLPVEWNPSSAIRLHVPLQGQIVHDYSASHPEITLQGTANEAVLAAGSGNVTRITKTDSGSIVIIDHGKVGQSVYTGVYQVSVKQGQYVSSGQVIGHLSSSASPALQFGFEHDGRFVNPHDYIHFSSGGA